MTFGDDPERRDDDTRQGGTPDGGESLDIRMLDERRRRECLSAYLDGELSPAEARSVTAWLDEHPDALRDVEHLRRVWDLLDAYEDEPVPEGFAAATMLAATGDAATRNAAGAQVSDGRTAGRVVSLARFRRPAFAAAAAALLIVGAAIFLHGRAGTPTPEAPATASAVDVLADLPAEVLADDMALEAIASLDDEAFDALVAGDYDDEGLSTRNGG